MKTVILFDGLEARISEAFQLRRNAPGKNGTLPAVFIKIFPLRVSAHV
jgi:hypothetical protein